MGLDFGGFDSGPAALDPGTGGGTGIQTQNGGGGVIEDIGGFVGGTIGAIGGIVGGEIGPGVIDPFGDGAIRGPETGGFDLGGGGAIGPLELDLRTVGDQPLTLQPVSINPSELVRAPVVRCPDGTIATGPCNGSAPGVPGIVEAPAAPGPLEQLQNLLSNIGLRTGGPRPTIGAAGTRLVAGQQGKSPLTTILILAVAGGIGYYLWRRYKKGKGAAGGGGGS